MKPDRRIVQEHRAGGWEVKAPKAEPASSVHDRQSDAIDRARGILSNAGGGELTIKDRHGRFRDSDTVPHGNDPNPPRDRR
jgi:hypothetical protein